MRLLQRIKASSFAKNSLTLSTGVAVAQVLPFLFYPILGRIFSAADFGLLATITSITSILAVVGSGKYEGGILIARDKVSAANLAVFAVVLSFAAMLLSWFLIQFVLIEPLSRWFKEPDLSHWIFVCPLAAFCIIVFNVYNEWCVREKYFVSLSVNKIVNAGAVTLAKVFLGFVRISAQGLVVGDLVGRVISALGCAVRAWVHDAKTFMQVRWKDMMQCAVAFSGFPRFTMPGQLLNTVGQSVPVLLIAYFFDKTQVGYFSMALTLFAVPINIISSSIRDVYRQRAVEEFAAHGNCLASFDKVLRMLSLGGVVVFLLFEWFLPQLTRLFLGAPWEVAGRYAQILAPAMLIMFVSNSLTGLFIVADKLRQFFWWQFYFCFSTILAVWVGGYFFHTMQAILILFAILRSTAYVASIVITRRYAAGNTVMSDR